MHVVRDSALLEGLTLPSVLEELSWDSSWRVEGLGDGINRGRGWLLRQYHASGAPTGRMIRWHPPGGRHGGGPYWLVTSPEYGKSAPLSAQDASDTMST